MPTPAEVGIIVYNAQDILMARLVVQGTTHLALPGGKVHANEPGGSQAAANRIIQQYFGTIAIRPDVFYHPHIKEENTGYRRTDGVKCQINHKKATISQPWCWVRKDRLEQLLQPTDKRQPRIWRLSEPVVEAYINRFST